MENEKDEATNYSRWSHELQRGNSSKGRQKSFTDEVCEELGLEITNTIIDDGVSARYGDNLEANFATLLTMKNPPKYLIIEEWSRLSRAGFWTTSLKAILPLVERGIKVVVGRDEDGQLVIITDKNINNKRIINYIMDGSTFAQKDNEVRIKNFKEAWVEKRANIKDGKYAPMNFPPCWLKCPRNEKGECIRDTAYIQDEVMVKRIQQVFRLFAENDWSVYHTIQHLNVKNIPVIVRRGKSFGKHWTIGTLQDLLRNKAVIGHYQRKQYRIVPRQKIGKNGRRVVDYYDTGVVDWESKIYPPIVDETTYWKVQEKLARMYKGRRKSHEWNPNLFYRVLQCKCGGYMNLYHYVHKGKHVKKYVCGNALVKKCPNNYSSIKKDHVEFAFKSVLSRLDSFYEELNTEKAPEPSLAPVYQLELEQLRKERTQLYSLLKKLDTQPDDLVNAIQQSLDKEKRLYQQIENENIRIAGIAPMKKKVASYKEVLESKWNDANARIQIRQFIRDLVIKTEVDVKDKTIKMWFRNASEPIIVKLNKDDFDLYYGATPPVKFKYENHETQRQGKTD